MSNFSINNQILTGLDDGSSENLMHVINPDAFFPNFNEILMKLASYQRDGEINKFIDLLAVEPVMTLRLLSKYKLSSYQALNIFMEQNAVFGDKLNLHELSKNNVEFKSFFRGRISSLLVFYEITIGAYISKNLNENEEVDNPQLVLQVYLLFLYLLSIYKPEIYAGIMLKDNYSFEDLQALIKKHFGKQLSNFSSLINDELSIDKSLLDFTHFLNQAPWQRKRWGEHDPLTAKDTCICNYMGMLIARELMQQSGIQGLQSIIRSLKRYSGFSQTKIMDVIGGLPKFLKNIQRKLGLKTFYLPDYVNWFNSNPFIEETENSNLKLLPDFLEELNLSLVEFNSGMEKLFLEASWVTLKAMLTCFNFQRACYFYYNEESKNLEIETCLGTRLFEYEETKYNIEGEENILNLAFKKKSIVSEEHQLFRDGYPAIAFPIFTKGNCKGVFYADKAKRPNSETLENSELLDLEKLAKCWLM